MATLATVMTTFQINNLGSPEVFPTECRIHWSISFWAKHGKLGI